VDQGTGPEPRDPVLGWAAAEDRAAEELVVAEPAGAGVLVRQEEAGVPACGIPVWPEPAVVVPGQVAELEVVVGLVPAVGAARVVEGQELVVVARERVAEVELVVGAAQVAAATAVAKGQAGAAARGPALVGAVGPGLAVPEVGLEQVAGAEAAVDLEVEVEGPEPAEELDLQADKALRRGNG